MNYLKTLLDVLSPEELARLDELHLRGKEAEIMQAHVEHRLGELPAKAAMMQSLQISGSHLDKAVSLLLQKALRLLAGDSPNQKFAYLNRKHLDLLNFHEMAKQEKVLLKQEDPAALAEYFKLKCQMHYRAQFPHFRISDALEAAEKYLHYLEKLNAKEVVAERIVIYCSALYPYIHFALVSRRGSAIAKAEILGYLTTFQDALDDTQGASRSHFGDKWSEAYYHYHKTASYFEWRFNNNVEGSLAHLESALAYFERNPESFAVHDKVFLLRSKADIYYGTGVYDQAYQLYSLIYLDHFDSIRTNFYHLDHFAESAMLTGHMELAQRLVDVHYHGYIQSEHETMFPFAAITVAKFLLLTGKPSAALTIIQRAMHFVERRTLTDLEIELRTLETAAFLLMHEWKTVEMLSSKNLKYLETKKISLKSDQRGWFFQLASAICDERIVRKQLTARQESKLMDFNRAGASVYGKILELVRTNQA